MILNRSHSACFILALLILHASSSKANAEALSIQIENLSPDTGFFLTPLWFGLHDGSFDLFDVGSPASSSIEELAEDGITTGLEADFAGPGRRQGVITGPAGFGSVNPQPPLIDAGETAATTVDILNASAYRYFSFASMVIPSNDAFIGNDNPMAYEVFDALGNFNGPVIIEIFGDEIWDSGTEVNDTLGAAFSTIGGMSSDEGGTVALHAGLANFEGTGTPVGNIGAGLAPEPGELVARITIQQVPEPSSIVLAITSLLGISLFGVFRRRHAS